jgi:hypothetical protein
MQDYLPILGLALVLVVIIGVALLAVWKTPGASFVGLAPLVPMVSVIVMVLTYILQVDPISVGVNSTGRFAMLLGSLAGLMGWLVFAWPYGRFALPSRANPRSFEELQYRLEQLDARLNIVKPVAPNLQQNNPAPAPPPADIAPAEAVAPAAGAPPPVVPANLAGQVIAGPDVRNDARLIAQAAYEQAMADRHYLAQELGYAPNMSPLAVDPDRLKNLQPGMRWIDATGYLNLWTRLHQAEEALIELDALESVIGGAVYDELRIQGSNIDNRDRLLAKLRKAVFVLGNPGAIMPASDYLSEQPPALQRDAANDGNPPDPVLGARSILRQVRRALNEYRDSKWEGLVIARNRLREAVTITWLTTLLLVAVLLLVAAPVRAVMAGAVFFLVGALVGMFDLLRIAASSKVRLEQDYGFARAQMLQTPLFSGLAALSGVVLFALVPQAFKPEAVQPATTAPPPIVAPAAAGAGRTPTATLTTTATPTITATPTRTPLAGTGGAYISVMSVDLMQQATLTPQSTTTPTSGPTATPTPAGEAGTGATAEPTPTAATRLDGIFDLDKNTFALVIAAIFGLTPGMLTSALRERVQGFIGDLNSTEAQDGGSK